MTPPAHKTRAITRTRKGEERLEYWVVCSEGFIRKCPPMVWHKLKLADQTPPSTLEAAALLRYRKIQTHFGKQVEDNAWLRAAKPPEESRYQSLCTHAQILF